MWQIQVQLHSTIILLLARNNKYILQLANWLILFVREVWQQLAVLEITKNDW